MRRLRHRLTRGRRRRRLGSWLFYISIFLSGYLFLTLLYSIFLFLCKLDVLYSSQCVYYNSSSLLMISFQCETVLILLFVTTPD